MLVAASYCTPASLELERRRPQVQIGFGAPTTVQNWLLHRNGRDVVIEHASCACRVVQAGGARGAGSNGRGATRASS